MTTMWWMGRRRSWIGCWALAIALVGGAASARAEDTAAEPAEDPAVASDGDQDDPLRPFNRAMFDFNDWMDEHALEPAARGWDFVVPRPVQRSVSNFYDNLLFPIRFANDVLQGEIDPAVVILSRFTVNTTVGLAGLFDVATEMGLPAHRANFGQTMGKWGIPPGPYLVLPLLGSSDVRDTVGLVVDGYLGVVTFFVDVPILIGSTAVNAVNRRSLALGQVESARSASLDLYSAARDAYFQQREDLVKGAEQAQKDRDRDLYFPGSEEDEGVFDQESGPWPR
jgi:phospholipid-binding lipoprotein MlaA